MKPKPKGPKYRNLFARAGVIYYESAARGRRVKISTKTSSWEDAAAFRDLYEQAKGASRVPFLPGGPPTLAEFALRYLAEDTGHLAATTREDRGRYLRAEGPILRPLGGYRLDEVTSTLLRDWWAAEIAGRGRTTATGRTYLNAISGVLGYAVDRGILSASPVASFR